MNPRIPRKLKKKIVKAGIDSVQQYKISSLVKDLSGVLIAKDSDKKGYADYLQKKYQ